MTNTPSYAVLVESEELGFRRAHLSATFDAIEKAPIALAALKDKINLSSNLHVIQILFTTKPTVDLSDFLSAPTKPAEILNTINVPAAELLHPHWQVEENDTSRVWRTLNQFQADALRISKAYLKEAPSSICYKHGPRGDIVQVLVEEYQPLEHFLNEHSRNPDNWEYLYFYFRWRGPADEEFQALAETFLLDDPSQHDLTDPNYTRLGFEGTFSARTELSASRFENWLSAQRGKAFIPAKPSTADDDIPF